MGAFRYEFTGKELAYFLFGRKKCPKCGGRLEKEKCFEFVDGSVFKGDSVPLYIQAAHEVKLYYYMYHCQDCGSSFSLTELAEN